MMESPRLDAALDLIRRLSPQNAAENLFKIIDLLPFEYTEILLNTIDIPSRIMICPETGREFLCSEYNRRKLEREEIENNIKNGKNSDDKEKEKNNDNNEKNNNDNNKKEISNLGVQAENGLYYRSPWSMPICNMETRANEAFDTYRQHYYEGGISSVYQSRSIESENSNDNGEFNLVILFKKENQSSDGRSFGTWNAIHVCQVSIPSEEAFFYRLTSTIILELGQNEADSKGKKNENQQESSMPSIEDSSCSNSTLPPSSSSLFNLSGSLTRKTEATIRKTVNEITQQHIINIGRLVEDMESKLRANLQDIYFGKTNDAINEIRNITDHHNNSMGKGLLNIQLQREMIGKLNMRKKEGKSGINKDGEETTIEEQGVNIKD